MPIRTLTTKEVAAAFGTFQSSITYSKVRVKDDTGFNGSPWTSPPLGDYPYYVLHVGPTLYQDLAKKKTFRCVFIHEMTHVWQGQHGVPQGYVVNSAAHQSIAAILYGGKVSKVYSYIPGGKWALYTCEQQASIVEDWYEQGSSVVSPLFPYISKNVRKGDPWA